MKGAVKKKVNLFKNVKDGWMGVSLAIVVGLVAVLIKNVGGSPLLDSLVVAMLLGILLNSFINFNSNFYSGFRLTPLLLIPLGAILYGAVNLNFREFTQINPKFIIIISVVFVIYFISIFILSNLFKLKNKVSYLITVGSAICGASAIAMTSEAIDADSDDVSLSLIPIFVVGLFGVLFFFPYLIKLIGFDGVTYSVLAGSVLQFTGFVKATVLNIPFVGLDVSNLVSIALSVKAVRYVGLLIFIPLFASLTKGKFYFPWYLLAFFLAGLLFSFVNFLVFLKPSFSLILDILWSIAMAGIGLSANIKVLFSKEGLNVFIVSLLAFLFATGGFFGLYFLFGI